MLLRSGMIPQAYVYPARVKVAYKANRVGIAKHFPQPVVARSISVDIAAAWFYPSESSS